MNEEDYLKCQYQTTAELRCQSEYEEKLSDYFRNAINTNEFKETNVHGEENEHFEYST